MSELRLDVGTANDLKLALRAARGTDGSEWEDRDVKALVGDKRLLGQLLDCVRGRAQIVVKKAEEAVNNILTRFMKIVINPAPEKRTVDCFTNTDRYSYRDTALVTLLPEIQPAQELCEAAVKTLAKNSKLIGMAQSLLGIADTDTSVLSDALIAHKHIYTLPQIEQLIERQEAGKDVGLLTNGWANFFLVLNNKEGSVSVVSVYRLDGRWRVYVRSLEDVRVWNAGDHFFSRN